MLSIGGMVLPGQDPETRIDQVISSATWIPLGDMFLVNQGKQEVLNRVASENWETPFEWRIIWINIPPQEAQQEVTTDIVAG